jgi:quercetin dioxygenase-like cupin family protein
MNHLAWSAVPEERLNPNITRRAIHSEGLTVARLKLVQGAVVPEHAHVNEQLSVVESGALKFLVAGREQIVRAGETLFLAPSEPHSVVALEDTSCMDIFTPARADWIAGNDAYLRR